MLDEVFESRGFDDPKGNLEDAIASYPHDTALSAIAIFRGTQTAKTLPPLAGPRYLPGIIRNTAQRDKGVAVADEPWSLRLKAHDCALLSLEQTRRSIQGNPLENIKTIIDHALATDSPLHRAFWTHDPGKPLSPCPCLATPQSSVLGRGYLDANSQFV